MQEIITAFGIDWRLIVIQIFNFTLLAGLLWYFLYKPVLNLLAERQEKIAQGVRDAAAAAAGKADADRERGEIVRAAHTEAEAIVTRAESHATEKGTALLAESKEKGARILADADVQARDLAARVRAESEQEIAKIAILAAEKVLREKH